MAYAGFGFDGAQGFGYGIGAGDGRDAGGGAGADVAVCDLASDESWEGLSETVWKIRNEGQVGLAVIWTYRKCRR